MPNEDVAISVRNLRKTYDSPWWRWGNEEVIAIDDLTLDIPKYGIFVLLGSNGFVLLSEIYGIEAKYRSVLGSQLHCLSSLDFKVDQQVKCYTKAEYPGLATAF